ncbi:MAG: hypothetical protein Q8S33_35800 [Myxococcales bacterium]|nr:hypothetical protein [Myxococcales bacterium]
MKEPTLVLTLVLALSLTVEPAAPPADGGVPALGEEAASADAAPRLTELPKDSKAEAMARRRVNSLLFGASTIVLGAGAALGSWFDREGTFGRITAVSAGVIGLGLLAAGVGGLITRLINDASPTPADPVEAGLQAVSSAIAQGMVALISGVVGMVAGGLIAGFTTTPPGTQRGVVGIIGGSLMAVTGTTVMIATW